MSAWTLFLVIAGAIVSCLALPVLAALLGMEAAGWIRIMCNAIVSSAARRLPPEERTRWIEEWRADVNKLLDRPFTALVHSLLLWHSAGKLAGELKTVPTTTATQRLAPYARVPLPKLIPRGLPPEQLDEICGRVREWLSLYLDGELSEFEYAMAMAHLSRCESCREFFEQIKGTCVFMRGAPLDSLQKPVAIPSRVPRPIKHFLRFVSRLV